jgi:hypothetical protein
MDRGKMRLTHLTQDELARMLQVANTMLDPQIANQARLEAYHRLVS